MALLKSSNPVLKEKAFKGTIFEGVSTGQEMTLNGTLNKFGILLLLTVLSTLFAWNQVENMTNPNTLVIIGAIGGLVLALVISFKPHTSPYLAPAYAIMEGLFVGAISAVYNHIYPGLPMQAVALTLLVCISMFLLYRYRIIRVTNQFRKIITIAVMALGVFYMIQFIAWMVSGSTLVGFTSASTPIGIGFSVLVVGLASLCLLLDFDMIETGVNVRAPKFMEWYCAFGLLVTVVWLYLELLRLLAKLRD
ncbi:MAG TPA: Bax inhibitor-1/YccA family protein [Chitinophagaceae bacterium]|jgi:uncharacterized YccA/Bax inhibitor family protein|nr:Bax inhibitor-1/YccA family protein [Chitinophagaceae bacterium]